MIYPGLDGWYETCRLVTPDDSLTDELVKVPFGFFMQDIKQISGVANDDGTLVFFSLDSGPFHIIDDFTEFNQRYRKFRTHNISIKN
jgi:hypothetical protein